MVKTWLSNAGGAGSIPGHKAKVPHASRAKSQNIKQKRYCNRFNKDFKDGPYQKQSLKINGLKHCPECPGKQRRGGRAGRAAGRGWPSPGGGPRRWPSASGQRRAGSSTERSG